MATAMAAATWQRRKKWLVALLVILTTSASSVNASDGCRPSSMSADECAPAAEQNGPQCRLNCTCGAQAASTAVALQCHLNGTLGPSFLWATAATTADLALHWHVSVSGLASFQPWTNTTAPSTASAFAATRLAVAGTEVLHTNISLAAPNTTKAGATTGTPAADPSETVFSLTTMPCEPGSVATSIVEGSPPTLSIAWAAPPGATPEWLTFSVLQGHPGSTLQPIISGLSGRVNSAAVPLKPRCEPYELSVRATLNAGPRTQQRPSCDARDSTAVYFRFPPTAPETVIGEVDPDTHEVFAVFATSSAPGGCLPVTYILDLEARNPPEILSRTVFTSNETGTVQRVDLQAAMSDSDRPLQVLLRTMTAAGEAPMLSSPFFNSEPETSGRATIKIVAIIAATTIAFLLIVAACLFARNRQPSNPYENI
eukprot:m.124533 g.124533  ORF g.124533 m.124533 type:complete len:427 (-) comp9674_c2_seq1:3137-4417(-)